LRRALGVAPLGAGLTACFSSFSHRRMDGREQIVAGPPTLRVVAEVVDVASRCAPGAFKRLESRGLRTRAGRPASCRSCKVSLEIPCLGWRQPPLRLPVYVIFMASSSVRRAAGGWTDLHILAYFATVRRVTLIPGPATLAVICLVVRGLVRSLRNHLLHHPLNRSSGVEPPTGLARLGEDK